MPRVTGVYANDPDKMPFDFPELIASLAPRAVFSNSPVNDANFDVEGIRGAEPVIRRAYEALGVGDRLIVRYPDYAHDFEDATRREAYRFIDAQLGYKPSHEMP
jgi:hypothetical protein